jgi:EmrB/QacA subfamily drug resistance transporter
MCLSLTLVVMSVSGLNVALPSIQRALDATNTELQWIVDAYALVFAGLLLPAGAIGDRWGRRNALLGGLTVFAGGAVVAGLGEDATQVIAGRVVMGVGAAFVMPATLSLVTSIFPPAERRRAIAVWAGFAGAGGAIGPIVSGALLEAFWWGSVLLVNVPIVIALMIAIRAFAPRSRDPEATPLDPVGALLSLLGISTLVYGIIEGPVDGWSDPVVVAALVIAAVTLTGFVAWERRTAHPLLPIDLFGDVRFRVGSAVVTIAFFAMFGFFFLNTQYLQFARGYSPLLAGVSTLPLAVSLVIVSPRSAAAAERFGSGPVIAAGFLSLTAGFLVLGLVGVTTTYLVLAAAYVLLGGGMGLATAPATGSIMSAVPEAKAGVGSAVNDTTRELGGALGIAVLGSIVNATYRSNLDLEGLGLPPAAQEVAEESVGAVAQIAEQIGPAGQELIRRADVAFTDAFNTASRVSAVVLAAAAVGVYTRFRPSRERAADEATADPAPDLS